MNRATETLNLNPVLITTCTALTLFMAGCSKQEQETETKTFSQTPQSQTLYPVELLKEEPETMRVNAAKPQVAVMGDSDMRMSQRVAFPSAPPYTETYEHPGDQGVFRVGEQPVSTFSIDVDTGSYANMRRWLNQGQLPPMDAVRVEEFINYFDYDYAIPSKPDTPFSTHLELAQTPWNQDTVLMRIGIQGFDIPTEQVPPANLVFLVDVSGSMNSPDKLPLLVQSLSMLTASLDAQDRIGIVVYAGSSGVVLEPVPGDKRATILTALQRLHAGGSTNGEAGIRLAYQLAQSNFIEGGINRVILATDGDFNVGIANHEELVNLIQRKRESGIALTTLGFGSGNYNDHLLEQLANEGNGNHAYIDRLSEAQKVLQEQLSSTLLTIASDVKIQVEFNPETVAEYRLIGYENRILDEEDFNNDRVDAGEIGAGHNVTALYELSLVDSDFRHLSDRRYGNDAIPNTGKRSELAHLRIRYKAPGSGQSTLMETPVLISSVLENVAESSTDFRFAASVAAYGESLRGGEYLGDWGWEEIKTLASEARGKDAFGYRGEFLQLISLAQSLDSVDRITSAGSSDCLDCPSN